MGPKALTIRTIIFLVFALCTDAPVTAQFNVDSVKQLLARTPQPVPHLKLLRQLSKANDTTTHRIYAWETIRYADSLLAHGFAGDFTVLTQKGGGMWNVGVHYERSGMPDSAYVWYTKAAAHWKAIGDTERTAFAYSWLSNHFITRGEVGKALAGLRVVLAAHTALRDTMGLSVDHEGMGRAYTTLGDYPRALDHYQTALRMAQQMGRADNGAALLTNIGKIYTLQEQPDTAITYFERAVVASKGSIYPQAGCSPLGSIAGIEIERKNYQKALKTCQDGLELTRGGLFPNEASSLYSTMAIAYQEMGDLDQAMHYGQLALTAGRRGSDVSTLAILMVHLSRTWIAKGRDDKALELANEAKALCASTVVDMNVRNWVAWLLSEIYGRTGPAEKALKYYREYMALNDSVHSADIRRKIALMDLRKQEMADSLRAEEARHLQELAHQKEMAAETNRKRLYMFGGIGVLLVAGGLWSRLRHTRRSKRTIEKEKDRSDSLLLNILPSEVAEELKNKGEAQARDIDNVSILFTDFKGFTQMSEQLTAQELVAEINTCFKAFDGIIEKHGVEKIKTIGDAYMAAGGLPVPTEHSARNTVLAALEMQAFMKRYTAERLAQDKPAFTMRLGIHTGPVVAGIVGVKKFQYDIWGDTVNIASRMESSGEVGQVNISEATYALVKDVEESSQLSVVGSQGASLATDNSELTTANPELDNSQSLHLHPARQGAGQRQG
jgi:adenylate cyclase